MRKLRDIARRRVAWWMKRMPSRSPTASDTDSSSSSARASAWAVEKGGQPEGGEIGVAQLHQPRGEDRVPAVETDVPHAGERRRDPVDRGAGQTGGALQPAEAQRPSRLGQLPQHGDPAQQRGDGLGGHGASCRSGAGVTVCGAGGDHGHTA